MACAQKGVSIYCFRVKDSFPGNRILDFARILFFQEQEISEMKFNDTKLAW